MQKVKNALKEEEKGTENKHTFYFMGVGKM